MTEERNSRDYSAEREIRKNRREKKNRREEDLGNAVGEAETHKYGRGFGNERECMKGCSERESEIVRRIGEERSRKCDCESRGEREQNKEGERENERKNIA